MTAPVRCSRTAYAMENVCGLHGELQNTRARTPRSKNTDQSRSVALDSEDGKKPGPSHGPGFCVCMVGGRGWLGDGMGWSKVA